MSETTGSFSSKDKCEVCAKDLILRQNWNPRLATKGKRICNDCYIEQKQTTKIKDKLANLRDRLVDEERRDRLVGWIKTANLEYAKTEFVNKAVNNARQKNANLKEGDDQTKKLNLDEVQKQALEECSKWTFESLDTLQEEHFVMADILSDYWIVDPIEGDMSATWHLAFHYCGYEGYDVDGDGLPLAKPGSARLRRINYVRKLADDLKKVKRFGIVAVRTEERPRRSRKEWRIVLCRTDEVRNKVEKLRIARHEGEIKHEALLDLSMNDTKEQSKSAVKQYQDLYNRER